MTSKLLLIIDFFSLTLITISALFITTYPLLILSSMLTSVFCSGLWCLLNHQRPGLFFATISVCLVHSVYFFSADAAAWISAFLIYLILLALVLQMDAIQLELIALSYQIAFLPELLINFIFGLSSADPLFLVLDLFLVLMSVFVVVAALLKKEFRSVMWIYILGQFIPVLNLLDTGILLYLDARDKKAAGEFPA